MKQIKVIGAGGIGTLLLDRLCQFLNYYIPQPTQTNGDEESTVQDNRFVVTIVDGDTFEQRNRERQEFTSLGNKAEIKARDLIRKYENIEINAIPQYLNAGNIDDIIQEDDIILSCVDNHDTRRLISHRTSVLENVTLISGGNGYDSGDVLTNVRRNGINLTAAITQYHQEIEEGDGQHPESLGCEALHAVEPQLIFANWGAAWLMACRFYKICILEEIDNICESDFDTRTAVAVAKRFPATP